jgi:cell division protease FtsH
MGGRAAEEIVLNIQTTGAGNDIETASDMARRMVCDYGMSENLGPLSFGKTEEQIFLGREIAQHRDYSEATAQKIDEEVRNIVNAAYEKASQLIRDNIDTLHNLAQALLERETLDGEEIDKIMEGEKKLEEGEKKLEETVKKIEEGEKELEGDEGEAPPS